MNKLQKYAMIAALAVAPSVMSQTGTVSGDLEEATKETFKAIGGVFRGFSDAITPQYEKDNDKRILEQVMSYLQMNYSNLFDEDYKEIARTHTNTFYINNLDVGFCNPPYGNYVRYERGEKCVAANAKITFDDSRIPSLNFGICAKAMPLSSDASVYDRNYNVDIETMVSFNPNTKQVQNAFDYYYGKQKTEVREEKPQEELEEESEDDSESYNGLDDCNLDDSCDSTTGALE